MSPDADGKVKGIVVGRVYPGHRDYEPPPCYCADELEDCGGEYVCECHDPQPERPVRS